MEEQFFPSLNIKRQIYKSSRIQVVIDNPIKESGGFPDDDLPDYIR